MPLRCHVLSIAHVMQAQASGKYTTAIGFAVICCRQAEALQQAWTVETIQKMKSTAAWQKLCAGHINDAEAGTALHPLDCHDTV